MYQKLQVKVRAKLLVQTILCFHFLFFLGQRSQLVFANIIDANPPGRFKAREGESITVLCVVSFNVVTLLCQQRAYTSHKRLGLKTLSLTKAHIEAAFTICACSLLSFQKISPPILGIKPFLELSFALLFLEQRQTKE
jgi:hypothetical protein